MHDIIQVTGNVKFKITLDPTIWIFDDRRFELADRISETNGLAIEIEPFIHYTEPAEDTTHAVCHLHDGEKIHVPLATLLSSYLCFAIDGKPIKEGGPALLYFADGSNKDNPIKAIREIEMV
ncbi:hypothetical protein MK805_01205 [Shimazuella sp. AN120528]|uniref:hypothetical protein n=1 Tax=Shimazuella soli TaxID=1892854 RepID=UPI001F0E4B27|nr:hypothetical protein [Shimazuella soli]MCH5583588.1 hypothetical protein [Shimazuella soli]